MVHRQVLDDDDDGDQKISNLLNMDTIQKKDSI